MTRGVKKILVRGENAEFQIIESLKTNRAKRAKSGEIFIEGIESIKQAFNANVEITRIITAGTVSSWAEEIIRRYSLPGTPGAPGIIEMDATLYRRLCDRAEPSEMLVTARPVKKNLKEISLPEEPFILVLDRPSDTGNLGSIIRSANAFGVDAIFIIGHSADPWDPKTIRSSMGSVFYAPPVQLESFGELEDFIAMMKNRSSLSVWGSDSGGTSSLVTQPLKRPLLLILGNEARGMSLALKNLCDGIIGIPIGGKVNSLNLASAASIFMWEVLRQTRAPGGSTRPWGPE